MFFFMKAFSDAVMLTWRTCMNNVEPIQWEGERVRTMELKWVVFPMANVHAHNLKTSPVIAHRTATSATEEIEKSHATPCP
jgi:hypothetical protein